MSLIKKMIDYSVDRVQKLGAFEMGLFKLTMFFLGMLVAASAPRICRRGKGLIAVITAILAGTFWGYFFFGERYFELNSDGGTAAAKKDA